MSYKKNGERVTNRDIRFDILRIMGLLCIFLAHSRPPELISQLRNFDVALMVIVSGAVFGLSIQYRELGVWTFWKRRVLRLVAPAWGFLFCFFVVSFIIFKAIGKAYPFSPEAVFKSFFLFYGNYIWIIRVFLLLAIVAPIFLKLTNRVESDLQFLVLLAAIYLFYELGYYFFKDINVFLIGLLVKEGFFYLLPYGCILGLGLRLPALKRSQILSMSLIFFLIFCLLAKFNSESGQFVPTQAHKYPPRLYYVSYAVSVSLLLYSLLMDYKLMAKFSSDLVWFMGASSMWIYLWHISILYLLDWASPLAPQWIQYFLVRLGIVIALSLTLTYLQKILLSALSKRISFGSRSKGILSIAFMP